MRSFDVIVVGAGPAGEVAAGRLGEAGLEVALVEDRLVGGECSYWACMPSKALLRPAELLAEVRRVRIEDGEELEARRAVVLATGSTALVPPIDGLADAKPWTNIEATTTKRIPASVVVLGGGVVGVEMAQAFRSLGADVSVVEALDRLIAREEPFASEQVTDSLRERGVAIHLGAKATRVQREAGVVTVTLEDGSRVTGEELLVAIGRTPRTEAVDGLGFEPGKPVTVDERGRTEHPWLFAVGDVNGIAPLTHMGKYQARLVADTILDRPAAAQTIANGARSPRVIFTDPQVAAVGHTLASAQEAGIDVRSVEVQTSGNAGGSFYGRNAPGTARIVIDDARDVIVGATITGAEVADFLHAFTIAVVAEVPLERLWHAVPCFPTRSELWLRLLEKTAA